MVWCGNGQGGQARGAVSRVRDCAAPAAAENKFPTLLKFLSLCLSLDLIFDLLARGRAKRAKSAGRRLNPARIER